MSHSDDDSKKTKAAEQQAEIISLNSANLDIEVLERRLELAEMPLGDIVTEGVCYSFECGSYCDCNSANCTSNGKQVAAQVA